MTINNIKGKCRIIFFKGNKKIDNNIGILIPRTPGMGKLDSLFPRAENFYFFLSNYDSLGVHLILLSFFFSNYDS